jgi:hypothetical protein
MSSITNGSSVPTSRMIASRTFSALCYLGHSNGSTLHWHSFYARFDQQALYTKHVEEGDSYAPIYDEDDR